MKFATTSMVIATLLVSALPAAADRVGAEAHFAMAEKALAKGAAEEAEASLRKSVAEDAAFLPARLALGDALLARGEFDPGLAEIRAAGALAADPAASAAWPAAATRALKRARDVEAVSTALQTKRDRHVAECLALAMRWLERDPDLARSMFERVLRLVPGHPEAASRLAAVTPTVPGKVTPLFQKPEDCSGSHGPDTWKLETGTVSVHGNREGCGLWMNEPVSGDFDLRAEVRLVAERGVPLALGLIVIHDVGDATAFGLAERLVRWEELPPGRTISVAEKTPAVLAYDPAQWTSLEMRFRGDRAQGWLAGKKVFDVERRNPQGRVQIGLRWTQAEAEFRKVELFQPEPR